MKGDNQKAVFNILKSLVGQDNILTVPRLFIELTGSIETALFLSQCVYWSDRTSRTDGYFYKSYKEWTAETCLSERSLDKARKTCAKWITTKLLKANGAPTLHFKVDMDILSQSISAICTNPLGQTVPIHSDDLSQSLTETTTKITTDIKDKTPIKRIGVTTPKEPDPRSKHPAILMVKGITGKYPNRTLWDDIIKQVGDHPDGEKAAACYRAWVTKGYNASALTWLTEWYKTGIPKYNGSNAPARRQAVDADGNVIEVT